MFSEILPSPHCQPTTWQTELRQAIDNPLHLLQLLKLSPTENIDETCQLFKLRVPQNYVKRMRQGDISDPLLRQVLPLNLEHQLTPGYNVDPVGEQAAEKTSGLLHKYQGRMLLMTTSACAIHCRYCFRRHYQRFPVDILSKASIFKTIAADSSIHEIILSGGDPLMLSDADLRELVQRLATIPQIQRLRIHTRLPIVLPSRINESLLQCLTATRLQSIIVVHANHPNEIDTSVQNALQQLVYAGLTVLNQSVLLHGVNDNATTLAKLSEALFTNRVLPYYLHLLDPVQGAAHFAVPQTTIVQLLKELRTILSGYLVPRCVREIAGMPYKEPVEEK